MAQSITPALEAILAQELQVGADKPRGEIEIDYVIPGFTDLGVAQDLNLAYGTVSRDAGRHVGYAGVQAIFVDPTYVNDGDQSSFATLETGNDGYWEEYLKSDLGAAYEVTAFLIYSLNDTGRIVGFEYSTDGTTWTALTGTETGSRPTPPGATFTFTTPITARYWALKASAGGFHPSHKLNTWGIFGTAVVVHADTQATATIQVASIDLDRSRKMSAAQLDVLLDNEAGTRGWYTGDGHVFVPNNPIRAFAWYGATSSRVRVFTGLLDRLSEHRNPKTLALKARSRMKWMIEQIFVTTASQVAGEAGAVRTEANGVYLAKSPEYIFNDICTRAGWPAAARSVGTSGFTLSEYDLSDGSSWVDQIAGSDRLTTATGWDLWEDELGVIHFEVSPLVAATSPTPAWAFAAGLNVMVLDHETDDEDRITRVEVSGPMTSAVPKWEQVWSTSVLSHPVGVWYDPTDASYIKVIDRVTKYLYRMKQSDRSLMKLKYLGGYPLGLSGDPTDSTRYYILNAPWRNTGSTTGNSVKKYNASTHALIATYSLPDGRWTDIKTDGTNIWLTNYDDGKLYKRSMTATAVASYTITYGGVTQAQATGLWLNGTAMGVFFSAYKRFLVVSTSAPNTVTSTQSTQGTRIAGGEIDTTTDIDLYACAPAGSFGLTSGMVAKFTLAELVTNDVSATAVDYDLEDALGFQSGIANRTHTDCPNVVGVHKFESRLGTYSMKVVQSLAQAQTVAEAQLSLRSRLRRQLDLATIGHPGVQVNDPVSYVDAVAGMSGTWVIDTYRARIAATYTQTMSLLPWEAP